MFSEPTTTTPDFGPAADAWPGPVEGTASSAGWGDDGAGEFRAPVPLAPPAVAFFFDRGSTGAGTGATGLMRLVMENSGNNDT
jgi:hypothetical protein